MKLNKKIGLMSLVSLLGLVACGGNGDANNDVIEVNFWHTFGQGIVGSLKPIISDFERLVLENDGVKVKVNLDYGGDYNALSQKISKGFSGGSVPTLAIAYPDNVADYLYAEKKPGQYVVNFDDYMDNEEYGFGKEKWLGDKARYNKEDIQTSFLEEGQHYIRKGTYSLPYMKSSEVMFYNKEALEMAVGLFKPEMAGAETQIKEYIETISWEEFMNLCGFIAHSEEVKDNMPSLIVPAFYDSDANLFISKMYQEGIAYSSIVDGKGHIDFAEGENRTKAEALVTELKADNADGRFITRGLEGTYGTDHFKNAQSIFSIGSTGGAGYNLPSGDDFTVGVCPVPASNNNPYYVSQGPTFCMLRNPAYEKIEGKNENALLYAWKLIKYLTNPDNNVRVCITGSEGYVPIRKSAYENAAFLNYLEEGETLAQVAKLVIDGIQDNYINSAVFTGSAKLRDQSAVIITRSLKGEAPIHQIFDEAINEVLLNIH